MAYQGYDLMKGNQWSNEENKRRLSGQDDWLEFFQDLAIDGLSLLDIWKEIKNEKRR